MGSLIPIAASTDPDLNHPLTDPSCASPALALGLSAAAQPLLDQLVQQGLVDTTDGHQSTSAEWLAKHWQADQTLLVIGAIGAVTRLIAPLLQGKDHDPAVLVMDLNGNHVIPVLGGHSSGAEQRARELAAALGSSAVITGACANERRLALDAFGNGW